MPYNMNNSVGISKQRESLRTNGKESFPFVVIQRINVALLFKPV